MDALIVVFRKERRNKKGQKKRKKEKNGGVITDLACENRNTEAHACVKYTHTRELRKYRSVPGTLLVYARQSACIDTHISPVVSTALAYLVCCSVWLFIITTCCFAQVIILSITVL